MAERALPAALSPRTVTVRSLVVVGVVMAIAATGWCLRWVTGLAPLGAARSGIHITGLSPTLGLHTGPPMYQISGDRPRLVMRLALHNSASVPVRITGAEPIGGSAGPFVGGIASSGYATGPASAGAFRPFTIGADGSRYVTLVLRVNPATACGRLGRVPPLVFHFTTLGEFNGTQTIPLAEKSPSVIGRC